MVLAPTVPLEKSSIAVPTLAHVDLSRRGSELVGTSTEVDFIWRAVVERLMAAQAIVQGEVLCEPLSCLAEPSL